MSKAHHHRRKLKGRHLLTIGALALLALSAYELWIRIEDFWAWTAGIRHLSAVRGNSFAEDLVIVFETPAMRQLGYKMLFLILTMIFSLICLIRRDHARGGWILMLMDAAVAGTGAYLGLYSLNWTDWAQVLKLLPLMMIMVGLIINYINRAIRLRRRRQRPARPPEKSPDEPVGEAVGMVNRDLPL